MDDLFAACAPGLEPWLARELTDLGGADVVPEAGGVAFRGDDRTLYRAAFESGLATTLRVRLGTFAARRFDQVVRGVSALPWREWLPRGAPVTIKATCRKSRLYHSGAVAERIREGIGQAQRRTPPPSGPDDDSWTVLARVVDDVVTVSVDVVGAPLYRREYRQATAKAPLRADLARALLVVADWDPDTPLVDPFCGAGTVCIEAAALARRLPPGRLRHFALQRAPRFDAKVWADVKASALAAVRPAPAAIMGSDRDAGAVEAARRNAERAGVDVDWSEAPLGWAPGLMQVPGSTGLWASNPPYGRRTGDQRTLRNLYQSMGHLRRELPEGWRLALVVTDPALARATGVTLSSAVMTDHGGVKVRFMVESPAPAER